MCGHLKTLRATKNERNYSSTKKEKKKRKEKKKLNFIRTMKKFIDQTVVIKWDLKNSKLLNEPRKVYIKGKSN